MRYIAMAMPILSIKHVTSYRYLRPVAFGEHRMMLRPRDDDDQRLLQSEIGSLRSRGSLLGGRDRFGNYVAIAHFADRSENCALSARFVLTTRRTDFMRAISRTMPECILSAISRGLVLSKTIHFAGVAGAGT